MNVRVLSTAVLFFIGQAALAQNAKKDSVKTKTIDEVVVLGYSKTSTKAKTTAASTTISAEVLENRPNVSFLNSVQGAAPGIQINSTSGSPGSGKIDVRIRGLGTLNASTEPLYVIDGLATSGSQFRNLNTNDIESVSVLRDAQATSIYGNRAANGVVVITTKGGKFNSGLKVNYDFLTTAGTLPTGDYHLASSHDLLYIQKAYGAGLGSTMTEEQINAYGVNTNWEREIFRTSWTQQHNVGLRFGGDGIGVYSSLGYLENEGAIRGTDFKRFTFRNNINGRSKDRKFTFNSQLAVGYSKRHQLDQEENAAIDANVVQNALLAPVLSPSTLIPYPFVNGQDMYNHIGGKTTGRSAWILQDSMNGGVQNEMTETSIVANLSANYKVFDFLTIGNKSGIDYKQHDKAFARSPLGYLSVNVAHAQGAQYGGVERLSTLKDFTFSSVTSAIYNQKFGAHSLNAGAYLEYLKGHYIYRAQVQNGLNPLNWELGAGTGYVPFNPETPGLYLPSVSASKINVGTLAVFGTVDYDYAGKYGISGTLRRDGTYRFTKENRWETFWSVAGRWNLDKEAFLDGTSVRLLKLRLSYGTQGNQNLGAGVNNINPLFVKPNLIRDVISTNTGYLGQPGFGEIVLTNPDIQWESQSMWNAGVDFAIFNGKLEGSVDAYRKLTSNLFNKISVSATTGAYTIDGNNGEMENKGIEAMLKYNIIRKSDLKLSVFANGSYNKNKILKLDKGADLSDDIVNAVGGPAYQWNLIRYVGVNQETGEQQFLDKNGNITESPDAANDRVLTGKSFLPKYSGGFGFDVDYKGFYANVMFTYQLGGWQYDNLYSWLMDPYTAVGFNASSDLMNAWTPENTHTDVPAIKAQNMGTEGSSDRFLYRTDYLRLKNVAIGYTFSKEQLENLPVKGLKIFIQGENLYTLTGWKGYDPEPIMQYSLGVYPNSRTYSVGLNVEF